VGYYRAGGYYAAGDVGGGRIGVRPTDSWTPKAPVTLAPASLSDNGGGYRRRNFMNIRAARRAISRLKGFERMAKSIYHFVHRKPGSSGFKAKRRKRC
jgi:hypothetical protein